MANRLKGQRTRLVKRMEEVAQNYRELLAEDHDNETKSRREDLKTGVATLKEMQNRYEQLCDKIEDAKGEMSSTTKEGEYSMDLVLDVSEVINKLSARLEVIEVSQKLQSSENSSTHSIENQLQKLIDLEVARSQQRERSDSIGNNTVSLPKLDFAPYYGDVLKWNEFWDSFTAAVDNNRSLQPVQKLAYLLSKLRGEAKAVVTGFQTTDENYQIVIDLLRERFGDQQTAITAHYSKIMEIQPVQNDVEKLRSLHDQLEQHLRCLAALGEDTDHRHFISLIMTKLPKEVITRLEEMKGPEESWTVQLLRSKLRNHLVAREAADRQAIKLVANNSRPVSTPNRTPTNYYDSQFGQSNGRWRNREPERKITYGQTNSKIYMTKRTPEQSGRIATAETLYASEKVKQSTKKPRCVFCKNAHWSNECRKYSTIESRKNRLKEEDRCFNCLRHDHNLRNCLSDRPCFYCQKTRNHNSSICYAQFAKEKETAHVVAEEQEGELTDESLLAGGERALLQTAVVKALSKRSERGQTLRLLFDSGSHRTYISQKAVEQMGIKPTGSETISVHTFGAKKSKSVKTQIVEISLELEDKSVMKIVGNVVPTISASIRRPRLDLSKYNKILRGLKLADTIPKQQQETTIDILIGSDYYMDLLTFEKKEIGYGLHLLGSKFGWIITGRTPRDVKPSKDLSMLILNVTNQSIPDLTSFSPPDKSLPIDPNTEDYWNLETIGIHDAAIDVSDEEAITKFNQTIEYNGNRYMVKWPWKEEHPPLPSNFELSLGRLKALVRRLSQNPELMEKYNNIIQDQASKNVIEKVQGDDKEHMVHYIPHQAVLTPQKTTTKVRIVYDASAKTRKERLSLNECLLRGPVILENLCGLLMKFRLHKIGVVADIEKALLQVGLQDQDIDVVRFLWLKDPSKYYVENNLQIYRFCRVPFGVISSPFLLAATVQHHVKQSQNQIADQIGRHMYVDNMITGVTSPERASQLYSQGVNATAGRVNATAGRVNATAGRVNATAGRVNATAGRVNATAGRVNATAGRVNPTAGRVKTTAGRVKTTAGRVKTTADRVNTTAGRVNTTAGRVNTTAGRVNTTAGQLNTTACRVNATVASRSRSEPRMPTRTFGKTQNMNSDPPMKKTLSISGEMTYSYGLINLMCIVWLGWRAVRAGFGSEESLPDTGDPDVSKARHILHRPAVHLRLRGWPAALGLLLLLRCFASSPPGMACPVTDGKPSRFRMAFCAASSLAACSPAYADRCRRLRCVTPCGVLASVVVENNAARHATQLRLLLHIAGIEPNPGPNWNSLHRDVVAAVLGELHAEDTAYDLPSTKKAMVEELMAIDQKPAELAYRLVVASTELEVARSHPTPAHPPAPPPAPIPVQENHDKIIMLPGFSPSIVRTWFEQAEAILAASSAQTRQLSLIRALPTEVLQQSGADLAAPYGEIKGCILNFYDVSDECRLRRLLEEQDLGDRKPSVALRHLKSLAPGNDNLIRLRFLDMLPEKVRVVMATLGDVPVDTIANVADKTMELLSTTSPSSRGVQAVTRDPDPPVRPEAKAEDPVESRLEKALCQITDRLERLEGPGSALTVVPRGPIGKLANHLGAEVACPYAAGHRTMRNSTIG